MRMLSFAGKRGPGLVRERNEDRWFADEQQGLFIVADGMGGGPAGALAAEIVVSALPGLIDRQMQNVTDYSKPEALERVCSTIVQLSERVHDECQGAIGLEGMGSTVVMLLVRGSQAIVANLGDSRCYLLRDLELQLLSADHSLLQLLLESGEITPDDWDDHSVSGQLTRYVGMDDHPLPESSFLELQPGDRLLLCSDGLTGMLNGEELRRYLSGTDQPMDIVDNLIGAAEDAGGIDNITVVIVGYG